MALSNRQVVSNWASRKTNHNKGDVEWHNNNIHAYPGQIQSYGSHFVMAYFLGEKDGESVFLKNGDKYSISTSQHQSYVQQQCQGPTVPFSALRAAGVQVSRLGLDNIVDFVKDQATQLWVDKDGNLFHAWLAEPEPFRRPKVGMLIMHADEPNERGYKEATWHILGGCLLEWQETYYLCALDGRNYFVSQLAPTAYPTTVDEAFESLRPPLVQDAFVRGLDVKRQGEWFFVPTDFDDRYMAAALCLKTLKEFRANIHNEALPFDQSNWRTNQHVVRHVDSKLGLYARGNVCHRDRMGRATGQHRTLHLGDVWHVVVHNTAVRSWSIGGRVD